MQYIISCPGGCAQLLKNELKALGYSRSLVLSPSTVQLEADDTALAKINLRSRIANKVYLIVGEWIAPTFERLFDLVGRVERKKYIKDQQPFTVNARSNKSMLTSLPAIQSMGKKSISKKLTGNEDRREEDPMQTSLEIVLSLDKDNLQILLNTTGDSLHRRGYRTQAGEAPIKENLAAALILATWWKFRDPLIDITCGAGTILIEAAMIAKNIAPGLRRDFAFESFDRYSHDYLNHEKTQAMEAIITDKEHTIAGSDIEPWVIAIAKENAERAGVAQYIEFSVQDMTLTRNPRGCFLSNPPYGERLQPEDIDHIYDRFNELFLIPENYGGIVTSYEWNPEWNREEKSFYNGPDKVIFWKKKL